MTTLTPAANRLDQTKMLNLSVADAVWIATATLHEGHPAKDLHPHNRVGAGFSTEEILEQVRKLQLTDKAINSVRQHINQHCVANRPPQPNRTCELFALGKGYRRLFRPGDSVAEGRLYSRHKPAVLPAEFLYLDAWYSDWCKRHNAKPEEDPLIAAIGIGKHLWAGEDAVEYVARLREGWEEDSQ